MKHKSKGFTLIEMIIAVSVGIFVIAIAYSLINISNNVFNKGNADIAIRNELRILMECMTKDIQNAQEVIKDTPFTFKVNGQNVQYDYDLQKKAIVREIDGKKQQFFKNEVWDFNIMSDDFNLFHVNIDIYNMYTKNHIYDFYISRRIRKNSNENSNIIPTDYGYLMTLVIGQNMSAGGVIVTPNENSHYLFYKSDYENGFDIVIEDMPGNQGKFRIIVFGYSLTYNYDVLDTNKKIKAMYIENLSLFDKDIAVYNYSSYHVNIGYDNKKVEIPAGKAYKYHDEKWKNDGNI